MDGKRQGEVGPATDADEKWLIEAYGKGSEELADEAEVGYDVSRMRPLRDDWEQLITVEWNDNTGQWRVNARLYADNDDEWSSFLGDEGELDALLSIARDVVTGG